ncbi:N-acetyltransferase family protein [Mesorhizobium argentiipisi]|uniref:GNAT family N-acetyltransferase n=1 Tax=Mesorhizobium argentiipisi TaxID=3015175 RepID=A0ABU8K9S1_9HYPH
MFRRATYTDANGMAKIYNQAMKPGIFAISQIAPDTHNERVAWLKEHQDSYPAFVYEIDRTMIGWCSLSRFSVRAEYMDIAETSRYIDESHRGKGIGKLMHAKLIEVATILGFRILVSRVGERNAMSLRSSEHFFRRVVVLHEAVRIHNEWHNDVWLWKKLR